MLTSEKGCSSPEGRLTDAMSRYKTIMATPRIAMSGVADIGWHWFGRRAYRQMSRETQNLGFVQSKWSALKYAFNKLKLVTSVIAVSAFGTFAVTPTTMFAFEYQGATNEILNGPTGSGCLRARITSGTGLTGITAGAFGTATNLPWAAGTYFLDGQPQAATAGDIPITFIQNCGWTDAGDYPDNFETFGADGTYATDNYIGVRWRATDPDDQLLYDFEYAIEGLQNDPIVFRQTLVVFTTIEDTQDDIASFMLDRANRLASNQPGLTRFLTGNQCGPINIAQEPLMVQDDDIFAGNKLDRADASRNAKSLNANITENGGMVDGCIARGDVWAEISSSWSADQSYTLGTIGAHSFVNPDMIVGGMVQFDVAEDDINAVSGTGWMVGPYFVAKLPEQPFYFEGRVLYGQTDNEITPSGTYTDSFDTERWLTQLRATGEYQMQSVTLMPLLDFTRTSDSQKSYTDGLGNTIPGQTVTLTQVMTGVDFKMPLSVQTGSLQLNGGLSGIYAATDGGAAIPLFEDWRARTHLGLAYDMDNGTTLSASTFYDGLGTDYEAYGASITVAVRF